MSMKLLTSAFALSLLCGTSAMAQHDDHHGGGGPHGGGAPHSDGGGAPHGGGQPHGVGGGGQPHLEAGAGQAHFKASGGAQPQGQAFSSHATEAGHARGGDRGEHSVGLGPAGMAAAVDHGYHHGSTFGHVAAGAAVGAAVVAAQHGGGPRQHYNEQAFPHELHAQQHYQYRGQWHQPSGYYYRHWGYGDRLPFGWFARSFWLTDFWLYGLPSAPYGYVWVREGPDAVLVNRYTGEVVEVDYGVFY